MRGEYCDVGATMGVHSALAQSLARQHRSWPGLPRPLTSGPAGPGLPQKSAIRAVDVESHGPRADAKPSATPAGVAICRREALVSATATRGPAMARRP